MTNFSDIFKSDFLSSASINSFSIVDTLIALALSFVIGLFIFLIYKKTYKGVMYSEAFGISLVSMSMITTLVILAVTANIILSLGMVGALSIVRFRTAVKEPMDISFMFWAIAAGIVLGAGLIPLALIGTVIIGIVILIFSNFKSVGSVPYILVVNCVYGADKVVFEVIKNEASRYVLKSKTVSKEGYELTYEIRTKDEEAHIINKLIRINGVTNAVLVSYNGEYMS
ncbi:MAG: DUF4956 domain-containing protein [Eubacterium sp.]|nr:DUF4956 domain-containing protein [Eubacterium sp.]